MSFRESIQRKSTLVRDDTNSYRSSVSSMKSVHYDHFSMMCILEFMKQNKATLDLGDVKSVVDTVLKKLNIKSLEDYSKQQKMIVAEKAKYQSVLDLDQKQGFLDFLYDLKQICDDNKIEFLISLGTLQYTIELYNHCVNKKDKLPVISVSKLLSNVTESNLILFNDYKEIFTKFTDNKKKIFDDKRRNAIVKGTTDSYLDLSRVQSKNKFGVEY